ncbi:ATP-binding protein [Mesorhizobium amorphae]|uniref:ATP-binding protein n=1 Tax=Mesorhizobium amorphae TaxID=71433 RepID=UPI001186C7AC|nr:ATP-binding protein [Mesorhizobium amorphae]
MQVDDFGELTIGSGAIKNYARMPYTMWFALAEFIDNSTQSRLNYPELVDEALKLEGNPLTVEIEYNVTRRELTVTDNSIGMSKDDLIAALKIAQPTKDSKGRSKYGMGMKTAACWIGNKWKIETAELTGGEEWTADIDVDRIAAGDNKIPLTVKGVSQDEHYTKITITDLNRNLQSRTDETIKAYLSSIYRFDLQAGRLKIIYRGEEIQAPPEDNFDVDMDGKPMKLPFEHSIGGKKVKGFVGVLKQGAGGRKFAGFSLYQNQRQIKGFPTAWKPSNIFGGINDEGANNLVSQRLIGILELDPAFHVSHTKDAVLYTGNEEEDLEDYLFDLTKDYREFASRRRGGDRDPIKREKFREMVADLKSEFVNDELKDVINTSVLPPLETILANNAKQVEGVLDEEKVASWQITADLRVDIWIQDKSENDPYVVSYAGAGKGTIHIIINRIHPYYTARPTVEAIYECIRQYIYDAVAEYRVGQMIKVTPDSVRRMKDSLLRADANRIENIDAPGSAGNAGSGLDQA